MEKSDIEKQLEIIFSRDHEKAREWALSQLPPGATMAEGHFGDYFTVHPIDFYAYLDKHGFKDSVYDFSVEDSRCLYDGSMENRRCLEETSGNWETYYVERGKKEQRRIFATKIAAENYMLRLLVEDIWLFCSQYYRNKYHPGKSISSIPEVREPLEKFIEAWPDGSPLPPEQN